MIIFGPFRVFFGLCKLLNPMENESYGKFKIVGCKSLLKKVPPEHQSIRRRVPKIAHFVPNCLGQKSCAEECPKMARSRPLFMVIKFQFQSMFTPYFFLKVAIQLEDAVWIFDGVLLSVCSCVLYMLVGKVRLWTVQKKILFSSEKLNFLHFSLLLPLFSANVSFYVGLCWMLTSILMDLETDLSRLNLETSAKRRNDFVVKETFCKIVTFYSDAKQLSESYLNIQNLQIHIELQLFW